MRLSAAVPCLTTMAFFMPLFAVAQTAVPPHPGAAALKAPIVGLWLMGQSLCEGAEASPVVTTTDTGWGNYSFKRGVRTWIYNENPNKPTARPDDYFTFVPLTAAIPQTDTACETVANGLADHLKADLLRLTKNSEPRTSAPHFLVTYAGQGGHSIGELSKADEATDPRTPGPKQDGGYYRTSLDDAKRATAQAKARGQDFAIAAFVWMQGEANDGATGGIVPHRWDKEIPHPAGQAWYRDRLMGYRKDWSADLTAITGQKSEIPMFVYQTLGTAGEAQVMAADADPLIYMVGPHYPVPSAVNSRTTLGRNGNGIHISADGERWYGEQIAKVVRRVLVENEAWEPMRPLKAWIDTGRTSILIEYHVPRPPLVLDTDFFPLQQNEITSDTYSYLAGFRVVNAAGASRAMTKVETASPTRVRITFAEPLPTGTTYSVKFGKGHNKNLGKITAIRPGPILNNPPVIVNQPTTELIFTGDLLSHQPLKSLVDEGAFYLDNMFAAPTHAQAIIRKVYIENGNTILRFENRELYKNSPFAVGQIVTPCRNYQYGNIRDSDPEKALYTFTDPHYGRRQGQPYPLWNWSILFENFPIGEP